MPQGREGGAPDILAGRILDERRRGTVCGRFSLAPQAGTLEEMFPDLELPREYSTARYNISPTQSVLCVVARGQGRLYRAFRWGLIPSWSREAGSGPPMINARSETVASRPAFRVPFRTQRCLVLADGFYEWKPVPGSGRKQPYHIRLLSGRPFAFAGLWDHWSPPGTSGPAPSLESCAIITTEPNPLMRGIHDRMPVILEPSSFAAWLDPGLQDVAVLQSFLRPFPDHKLEAYAVATAVNSPRHDSPECRLPLRADLRGSLPETPVGAEWEGGEQGE